MKDDQLLQYSRQIMLPAIDIVGQQKLLAARVLIVGLGGLGCPAAMYLAAAGVGSLVLADFDQVELSNLQRQIAHGFNDQGCNKAASAQETLGELNPSTAIEIITARLEGKSLEEVVKRVDLVLDCSDRFSTRYEVNQACVRHKKPLVSGAAIGLEGQLAVFDSGNGESPCYRCLYPGGDDEQLSCSENGVIAPLTGVIGCMQALEAMKLLIGMAGSVGGLLMYDAAAMQFRRLTINRDPACPVCGAADC